MRASKEQIVRVNNRFPGASQPTNPGDDLLEEVRKSLKRLKVLEGLKAVRDPILTQITTSDDDLPQSWASLSTRSCNEFRCPSPGNPLLLRRAAAAILTPAAVGQNGFVVPSPKTPNEAALS